MNILMWVLAGGMAGWAGYKFFHANEVRGMMMSVVIGVVGGFFGGKVLAPMLGETVFQPGAFSPFALFMAVVTAVVCLTISNMLSSRFDI